MTPPNDMPADTELREQLITALGDNMDTTALEGWGSGETVMFTNDIGELAEVILQLIKQRDKARDAAIRIDELQALNRNIFGMTDASDIKAAISRRIGAQYKRTPTDQKEKE